MAFAQILSILFGAIGVLGGIAVFFNGARKDSIIAVLTKENLERKNYTDALEGTKSRLEAERDGYKRENEYLKELAQGSPQLIKMTAEFKKIREAVDNQTKQLSKVLKDSS